MTNPKSERGISKLRSGVGFRKLGFSIQRAMVSFCFTDGGVHGENSMSPSWEEVAMTIQKVLCRVLLIGCGSAFWGSISLADEAQVSRAPSPQISGREIFLREWLPNDPRSHGGDGLGPVFNESSCVACHNQGGIGGSGSESKNVSVISAARFPKPEPPKQASKTVQARETPQKAAASSAPTAAQSNPEPKTLADEIGALIAQGVNEAKKQDAKTAKKLPAMTDEERNVLLAALRDLHPGLAKTRSIVLHRSSTESNYSEWRQKLMLGSEMFGEIGQFAGVAITPDKGANSAQLGEIAMRLFLTGGPPHEMSVEKIASLTDTFMSHPTFRGQLGANFREDKSPPFFVRVSQRNTTSLFGAGLIDSIPDAVLIAAAEKVDPQYPPATGRVSRLKDGKIGRFGWKSQKASLYDFTMTACAVELGLHVPDHPQAGSPHRPDYQPAGFDLNQAECDALVNYLKELPAPAALKSENADLHDALQNGERLFAKAGCASCHTPQLGEVAGIYSDLLLHDMGPDGGDSGNYGVFVPDSVASDSEDPIPELAAVQIREGRIPVTNSQTLQTIPDDLKGAGSQEWRTPPLWGVRDSAPYLHDGRAKTLEQAIAMHGGEGHQAAINFFTMSKRDQTLVLAFLRTLVAPDAIVATK